MIQLRAITPKKSVVKALSEAKLAATLKLWAVDCIGDMQNYPGVKPWKHGFPKSGVRRGGKRTGEFGRRWSVEKNLPHHTVLANRLEYAGFVGGYAGGTRRGRQTAAMRARGWPSITEVGRKKWIKHLPNVRRVFRQI